MQDGTTVMGWLDLTVAVEGLTSNGATVEEIGAHFLSALVKVDATEEQFYALAREAEKWGHTADMIRDLYAQARAEWRG